MLTSRRSFTAKLIFTAGIAASGVHSRIFASPLSAIMDKTPGSSEPKNGPEAFKISIFSKHLQWLDYKEMANVLYEIGFDGADLTVRPGGHVLPDRVEEDLPKAAEALAREGKKIYMLTTAIDNADDPLTVRILKEYKLEIPVSLHYEYPLGGAENGSSKLTIERNDVISAMKKDLSTLKVHLQDAGLS